MNNTLRVLAISLLCSVSLSAAKDQQPKKRSPRKQEVKRSQSNTQQSPEPTPENTQPVASKQPQEIQPPEDPIYANRPTSEWIKQLKSGSSVHEFLEASLMLRQAFTERIQAGKKLGPVEKSAIPVLGESLRSDLYLIDQLRENCASALVLFGEDAVPEYVQMVKHQPKVFLQFTITTVGARGLHQIMSNLKNPKPATIEGVKEAVAIIADRLIVQGTSYVNDFPAQIKIPYIDVLHSAGKFNIPALVKGLKDDNAYNRRQFALWLGDIGPDAKDAIPALIEATKDTDGEVRQAAVESLAKVQKSSE